MKKGDRVEVTRLGSSWAQVDKDRFSNLIGQIGTIVDDRFPVVLEIEFSDYKDVSGYPKTQLSIPRDCLKLIKNEESRTAKIRSNLEDTKERLQDALTWGDSKLAHYCDNNHLEIARFRADIVVKLLAIQTWMANNG